MWLAFAILVPDDVHNFMQGATVQLFERYGSTYSSIVVPPHITIKQPFEAELEPSEQFFDRLAAETAPFEIVMAGWATFPGDEGVVFLDVEQDPRLFALQQRVLDELGLEPAPHESGEPTPYHFHGTVAQGLTPEQLEEAPGVLPEPPEFRFRLERLGMFVYLGDEGPWILYKVARVAGA